MKPASPYPKESIYLTMSNQDFAKISTYVRDTGICCVFYQMDGGEKPKKFKGMWARKEERI
jgi:hypothetical protein